MEIQFSREELVNAFDTLDCMREQGSVNMFGASIPLAETLGWDESEARKVVVLWMKTFDEDKNVDTRVDEVFEVKEGVK